MTRIHGIHIYGLAIGCALSLATRASGEDVYFGELRPDEISAPSREVDSRVYKVSRPESTAPVATENAQAVEKMIPVEVIKERYADTSIKIERQVMQDENKNYLNHGTWMKWDQNGTLIGEGKYRHGKRHGTWTRRYFDVEELKLADASEKGAKQAGVFALPEIDQFEAPFVSKANFSAGQLVGAWTIVDANNAEIVSWELEDDQLHGTCTWWHPNSTKHRQVTFNEGVLDGEWLVWDADGALASKLTFVDGRKSEQDVETYPSGEKYGEGTRLHPRQQTKFAHDWWNGQVEFEVIADGKKELKEGLWTYWHKSGVKLYEGQFSEGTPAGRHVWWHSNGQREAEGDFVDGKQHAEWIWWHANGQKKMEGQFVAGNRTGSWTSWEESGQVKDSRKAPSVAQATIPKKRVQLTEHSQSQEKTQTAPQLQSRQVKRPATRSANSAPKPMQSKFLRNARRLFRR